MVLLWHKKGFHPSLTIHIKQEDTDYAFALKKLQMGKKIENSFH